MGVRQRGRVGPDCKSVAYALSRFESYHPHQLKESGYIMTKKDIKDIFRQHKVQLGDGTVEMIEDHLRREVTKMAERTKAGNYKRLTTEFFWVALGDWKIESGPRRLTK